LFEIKISAQTFAGELDIRVRSFKLAAENLKILEDAELVRSFKDGLWVNYSLSDGSGSPYSASMIGNLRHWLDNESEIKELNQILPDIDRHDIVGK